MDERQPSPPTLNSATVTQSFSSHATYSDQDSESNSPVNIAKPEEGVSENSPELATQSLPGQLFSMDPSPEEGPAPAQGASNANVRNRAASRSSPVDIHKSGAVQEHTPENSATVVYSPTCSVRSKLYSSNKDPASADHIPTLEVATGEVSSSPEPQQADQSHEDVTTEQDGASLPTLLHPPVGGDAQQCVSTQTTKQSGASLQTRPCDQEVAQNSAREQTTPSQDFHRPSCIKRLPLITVVARALHRNEEDIRMFGTQSCSLKLRRDEILTLTKKRKLKQWKVPIKTVQKAISIDIFLGPCIGENDERKAYIQVNAMAKPKLLTMLNKYGEVSWLVMETEVTDTTHGKTYGFEGFYPQEVDSMTGSCDFQQDLVKCNDINKCGSEYVTVTIMATVAVATRNEEGFLMIPNLA